MKQSKLYSFLRKSLGPLVKILFRLEINGVENLPNSGRYILCPNHVSSMDPILLGLSLKRQIFFMAKAELFENKFLGKILTALGVFSVSRGKGDKTALETAKQVLRSGNVLGLFIEGTRSKTGELLKPKTGAAMLAFDTYSKVVPVSITGKKSSFIKIFRKNIVSFGKPLDLEQLEIKEGTGKDFRNASRIIMKSISDLRPKF